MIMSFLCSWAPHWLALESAGLGTLFPPLELEQPPRPAATAVA
jgi:hypothetical protein